MEVLVRDLLTYTQVTKFEKLAKPTDARQALASSLAGLAGHCGGNRRADHR